MKVQLSIGSYAGGIVATIHDETMRYQLGQSRVFSDRDTKAAVEDAIESLLRRILGEETGATVLPTPLQRLRPEYNDDGGAL